MKKILVLVITLCFISLSTHAEEAADFIEKVRTSGVVNNEQSILLHSNVYFYPNKKGHGLLSGGSGREKGHIVFTENGLAVISWDRRAKAYEVLHSENYSELVASEVTGNSPMVRLVTESKLSGKFNSYELMDSRNAITPNVNKTKEARKLIAAGIQGLDVSEAASAKSLSSAEVAIQQKKMQDLEERINRLEKANVPEQSQEKNCDCKCEK